VSSAVKTSHTAADQGTSLAARGAILDSVDPEVPSQALLRDQVDLLYQQAHSAAIFTLINGLLVVVALHDVIDVARLLAWLGLLVVVTFGRTYMAYRFRSLAPEQRDAELWRNRFLIGASLAGGCWGLAGTALYPVESPIHQIFLLIVVAGIAAGAISYHAAVLRVYIAYSVTTLLPVAVWLLTHQSDTHALIGLLTLVFLASLIATCHRIHGTLTESLRLRYENQDLIEDLAESKQELQGLNRRLQGEIAEHTRTENELRDSYQFLKRIMDNTTNAIYVLDRDGLFIHTNHVTCETTGYTREELFRSPFGRLFQERDREDVMAQFERVAEAGDTVTHHEVELIGKDRTTRTVSFNLAPLYEGDRISSVVGTAEDITERRKVEKLKSEFLSTVSHELRTPLTSIRGSLGLLHGGMQDIASDEARQLVGIAYKNTDRLINLINDLLDIQKLEAGEMKFKFDVYELEPLIEHAIEINQGLAEEYKVRFVFEHPGTEMHVRVDRNRFEQVLTNLLSNAVKFSPAGGQVELAAEQHGRQVRIVITDHGPGIPEEFRTRIFQKFAQADSSNTRQKGGTGLGLSITKGMMERMGGAIDFRSEVGQGTSFFVELPLTEPGRPAAARSEAH
jgi:PAS domain S-box-containing protein